MSKRKHIEKLVRAVAHQGVQLGDFDRLLFLYSVFRAPDVAELCVILGQSNDATYLASLQIRKQRGLDEAIATTLIALAELVYGEAPLPLFVPGPMREFCSWHDWDSFMMEFGDWVNGAAGPALSRALERLAAADQLSEKVAMALRPTQAS